MGDATPAISHILPKFLFVHVKYSRLHYANQTNSITFNLCPPLIKAVVHIANDGGGVHIDHMTIAIEIMCQKHLHHYHFGSGDPNWFGFFFPMCVAITQVGFFRDVGTLIENCKGCGKNGASWEEMCVVNCLFE